jgi:hypothetical protein
VKSREDEPESQTVGFPLSVIKNKQLRDEVEAMLLTQNGRLPKIAMDPDKCMFLKTMETFADLTETFERGRKNTAPRPLLVTSRSGQPSQL